MKCVNTRQATKKMFASLTRINSKKFKKKITKYRVYAADPAAQSPITISTSECEEWNPKHPLIYDGHWHSIGKAFIMNNGFTAIMTFVDRIERPLLYGGPLKNRYVFEQLHFHWSDDDDTGSEHSIDGKKYAGEAHLVHYNERYGDFQTASTIPDGLAVTGFMLNVVSTPNTAFEPLSAAVSIIPEENHKTELPTGCLSWILSVALNEYYTYHGSLTTEPYSQSVTWIVYENPVDISNEQMHAFRRMNISKNGTRINCNARPIQSRPPGLTIKHVSADCFKTCNKVSIIKSKL